MRALVLLSVVSFGCATLKRADVEELKPAVEAFHQRARWKDFRAAAELVVPERRDAFVRARAKAKDDRDLFVTDFQLEDAKVTQGEGSTTATAVSKLSWYRLPSTTEESATVTSVFVWREGRWLLESQDGGPFPELLPSLGQK